MKKSLIKIFTAWAIAALLFVVAVGVLGPDHWPDSVKHQAIF